MKFVLSALFFHLIIHISTSLIAYDCSHRSVNITTISMVSVRECQDNTQKVEHSTENIQLLQLADTYPIHIKQCMVQMSRIITYCGLNDYSSAVKDGFVNYLRTVSRNECDLMHSSGTWRYSYTGTASDITPNSTTVITPLLSGRLYGESDCTGGTFTDSYGTWENVVVQSSITITLNDYLAVADTTEGVVNLRGGTSCKLLIGTCIDPINGWTFWETTPINQCDPRLHIVLYEGPSSVVTSIKRNEEDTITKTYMVENPTRAFALQTRGDYLGCFFRTYITEHPKLIIVPSPVRNSISQNRRRQLAL